MADSLYPCTACHVSLTGSLDTFGDVDAPLCWSCWSSCVFDGEPFDLLELREIFCTPELRDEQEQDA